MPSSPTDKASNISVEHPTFIDRVSAYKTTQGLYRVRPVSNTHELQNLMLSRQNDAMPGQKLC